MAGIAKVTLVGNLGRDPETRYTPSGAMNVNFSVAVSRRWNDQAGQQQEKTTWFRVTCWGKLAEIVDGLGQKGYLVKGKQVFVAGSVELDEYKDQQGQTRSNIAVRADEVQLLGSRGDQENAPPAQARPAASGGDEAEPFSNSFDDVPF